MIKDKVVYSTDPNYTEEKIDIVESVKPEQQNLRIWYEKRPGNKNVSIVKGFIGTETELKELSKIMKKRCGIGGSVKSGEIIMQTKKRQILLQILEELGYFVALSGG